MAYVLLLNYPKLGPVCGLGYLYPRSPEDFEGRRVAPMRRISLLA